MKCWSCKEELSRSEAVDVPTMGAMTGKVHASCKDVYMARYEKKIKSKSATGGKAGTYHAEGGRVIRGTNST